MSNQAGSSIVLASSMAELETLSKRIAASNLIPAAYRGKPDDCYVAMLMGNELGIGPMQSMNNIDVIEGRPQSRSRLKKVLAQKHPACEYFLLIESTDTKATFETKKRGDPKPVSLTYTIEQATKAGLTRKTNWVGHPAAMLRARCEGQLADIVYADATLGLPPDDYSELEEGVVGEPVAASGGVVDLTPPKPETKGADALKATLDEKKAEKTKKAAEKNADAQDALFKEEPSAKPAAVTPEKSGNFSVQKNDDGSETLTREKKAEHPKASPPKAATTEKAPPPVGEQVPPKVEPPAVSASDRVQPEPKAEVFNFEKPPAGTDMTTWPYEKCLALAKLRGLDQATLKAELKAAGAKGPKTVTDEIYKVIAAKYPPAPIQNPLEPAREPGDDTEAINEEKRKSGDLF